MLVLARKLNEKIVIGEGIEVSVLEIRGDTVKLGIEAPTSVKVYRHEIYLAILEENKQAAASVTAVPKLPGLKP